MGILDKVGEFGDVHELVDDARGRTVYETGDVDAGIWTVGMAQMLIHDILSASEVVVRTAAKARKALQKTTA